MAHKPISTLEEWDAIDSTECTAGYMSYEADDPEPGDNHTRSYHHGWRMARFDRSSGRHPEYDDHMRLVRAVMDRDRIARGENPRGPWGRVN